MQKLKGADVDIVVGLQFGSESKGQAVETLCLKNDYDYVVRTGSENAGHTVYYEGKPYAMCLIPCAWIDKKSKLVLGAGCYIRPSLLAKEIKMVEEALGESIRERLIIDSQAFLHPEDASEAEQGLHEKMGSTGHGCGEAVKRAIDRSEDMLFKNCRFAQENTNKLFRMQDTTKILNECEGRILLEGTQGSGLSLIHGTYPYCTSRDTNWAQWAMEAGLGSHHRFNVIGVIRTYPIRVAGNSGPFENELSWAELSRRINEKLTKAGRPEKVKEGALKIFELAEEQMMHELGMPTDKKPHQYTAEERVEHSENLVNLHVKVFEKLEAESPDTLAELKKFFEITTVTKKLRRIADIDWNLLEKSVRLNGVSEIYLGFLNYEFPLIEGLRDATILMSQHSSPGVADFVKNVEEKLSLPVSYISTSAKTVVDVSKDYDGKRQ